MGNRENSKILKKCENLVKNWKKMVENSNSILEIVSAYFLLRIASDEAFFSGFFQFFGIFFNFLAIF